MSRPGFLLDTDICSYALANRPEVVHEIDRRASGSVITSVIVLGELHFGLALKRQLDRAGGLLHAFARVVAVHPLPAEAAEHYGDIRAALQKAGRSIGHNDTWIAAHARCEQLTLVTNNVEEFSRVPGLRIENWAAVR